jgi:hypothetical protein
MAQSESVNVPKIHFIKSKKNAYEKVLIKNTTFNEMINSYFHQLMDLEEDVFHIYAKFHLWKLRLSQDMPKSKCLGNRLNTGSQHLRP